MDAPGSCRACGLGLRAGARFCDGCGAPTGADPALAEYKQVTILFADVVRSMDIAARVGPERLREIMTELVSRSAEVVERCGGSLNSYTGDGIMALFGAPTALEDHAFRACVARSTSNARPPTCGGTAGRGVMRRDGVELALRIGINSGQVITGEISPTSYTAVGDQVDFAQRIESAAPPGGVMLGEVSARLVEGVAELRGNASVCWVTGPAGIGKSRLIGEVAAVAMARGAEVFPTYCQSHTGNVPFHAMSGLLRAVFGIDDLDVDGARERVRTRLPDAHAEDLVLLDDLLGIRAAATDLPVVDPEARRRRLTQLVETAVSARAPAVYVIEDVHWIDEVSESALVDFVTTVPGTSALVLITHRPEYRGALSRISHSKAIALVPLDDSARSALTATLLGTDPSTAGLATHIAERAAGNPFFTEEIVRDLLERGILEGRRGAYVCHRDTAEVKVPATVQATIAARIDRLAPAAKGTLNAAAVIGSRFNANLLADIHGDVELAELVDTELIGALDSAGAEYAFRHPLIRAVAYESQLKSERAQLHYRLATAIERHEPAKAEENAALIATHLDTAGEQRAAFGWHMRAARWLTSRDIGAARASWQRARLAADRVPVDEPDRTAMRIAPRAMLCATLWLAGGSVDEAGFAELRELCAADGDQASLVMGMAGLIMALAGHNRNDEALARASELTALLDAIGNPALTAGLLSAPIYARSQVGQMTEALRLAQRAIDQTEGDPHELPLLRLRALMARAHGSEVSYRDLVARYRARALAAGFGPLPHD